MQLSANRFDALITKRISAALAADRKTLSEATVSDIQSAIRSHDPALQNWAARLSPDGAAKLELKKLAQRIHSNAVMRGLESLTITQADSLDGLAQLGHPLPASFTATLSGQPLAAKWHSAGGVIPKTQLEAVSNRFRSSPDSTFGINWTLQGDEIVTVSRSGQAERISLSDFVAGKIELAAPINGLQGAIWLRDNLYVTYKTLDGVGKADFVRYLGGGQTELVSSMTAPNSELRQVERGLVGLIPQDDQPIALICDGIHPPIHFDRRLRAHNFHEGMWTVQVRESARHECRNPDGTARWSVPLLQSGRDGDFIRNCITAPDGSDVVTIRVGTSSTLLARIYPGEHWESFEALERVGRLIRIEGVGYHPQLQLLSNGDLRVIGGTRYCQFDQDLQSRLGMDSEFGLPRWRELPNSYTASLTVDTAVRGPYVNGIQYWRLKDGVAAITDDNRWIFGTNGDGRIKVLPTPNICSNLCVDRDGTVYFVNGSGLLHGYLIDGTPAFGTDAQGRPRGVQLESSARTHRWAIHAFAGRLVIESASDCGLHIVE